MYTYSKGKKKRRPKWQPKRGQCAQVEQALKDHCRVPAEWPSLRRPFHDVFLMKTSEGLLFAGPAGAWVLAQLDLASDFRKPAIQLLRLLGLLPFSSEPLHLATPSFELVRLYKCVLLYSWFSISALWLVRCISAFELVRSYPH